MTIFILIENVTNSEVAMARGGARLNAGAKPRWKHGKTKTIRVPEILCDEILQYARKLDSGEVIECGTESKVLNLSGISIRPCNGKSAIYLEDLARAGFEILPERLGKVFKTIVGKSYRA